MTATLVPADDEGGVAQAVALLRSGGFIAFPMETVYCLGADATRDDAVEAVFRAKQRPRTSPLITHVLSVEEAASYVYFNETALRLAEIFWPGSLTLVLERRSDSPLCSRVSGGLETAAVRIPSHSTARRLIADLGRPIAAPSANPSGQLSPTLAAHVLEALGHVVPMIVDAGPSPIGIESTVIQVAAPDQVELLRPGGTPREMIEESLGIRLRIPPSLSRGASPQSTSGQPRGTSLPIRMNVRERCPGMAFLGFGGNPGAHLDLSPSGNLAEAGRNLFAMLRLFGRPMYQEIGVAPIPEDGLGAAINDRLRWMAVL